MSDPTPPRSWEDLRVGVGRDQVSWRLHLPGAVSTHLEAPPLPASVPLTTALSSETDMAQRVTTQLLLLLLGVATVWAARPRTELLNVCMDAKHHKEKPSPEDELHKQVGRGPAWGGEEPTPEEEVGNGSAQALPRWRPEGHLRGLASVLLWAHALRPVLSVLSRLLRF